MSIFLSKNKYWQRVYGQVKLAPEYPLFISSKYEWQDVSTLIPFPLEKNENLESEFLKFLSFDLNSKKVNQTKIIDCRNIKLEQTYSE